MSNQLATRELRIELFPGFTAWIRPWTSANKVFFNVEMSTPYGKITALFSMDPKTFDEVIEAAYRANAIPRLWAIFKEQLGFSPSIYSVDTSREVIPR